MTTHIFNLKPGQIVSPVAGTRAQTLNGIEDIKGDWKVSRIQPVNLRAGIYALHLVPTSYTGPMGIGRITPEEAAVLRSVKCSVESQIAVAA